MSRDTRQASALGLEGGGCPSRTAPLGMTKTPTLRVSADMLVSQSRAPPPTGPSLGVPEREVPSRLRPALTLAKPRILGGSGPDLSPVPKNRKHVCRPWWPLRSGGRRAHPPPPYPQEAGMIVIWFPYLQRKGHEIQAVTSCLPLSPCQFNPKVSSKQQVGG
jgi:hypothetical protein